jgi:glycosyltransferase involved in cell wall biosynthesis
MDYSHMPISQIVSSNTNFDGKEDQGVSIIIPTYNRREYLDRCLSSVFEIQYSPLEIIVVNDASTDDTLQYLSGIKDPRLRIIHRTYNGGASSARNSGITLAKYEILAFTDDDCMVQCDWINYLIVPFSEPKCGLVIGETWYRNIGYSGSFPERLVNNEGAAWPMTCNMAYRREIFDVIGGFSDEYAYYHNEDTEMAMRAVANGWVFQRTLDAQVIHQEMYWTKQSLLASARNVAVAVWLKKDYPDYHEVFGKQIQFGLFIRPSDYLKLLLLPVIMPTIFAKYLLSGNRDISLFFTRWPLYILFRRFHIFRAAWCAKILVF